MSTRSHNQFGLLKTRRFLPLFLVQGLGAFNDNLFKAVIAVLITFAGLSIGGMDAQLLVSLSAGLFVLPFFLFSSLAGQLADKFDKSRMIRILKLCEVAIMAIASYGFVTQNLTFLLCALFCMGTQSAFFGPLKWGILPNLLHPHELVGGNALANAITFLAILVGTIAGSIIINFDNVTALVVAGCITIAVLGYGAAWFMPSVAPADPTLKINWNFPAETVRLVMRAAKEKVVFRSILGICWFWFLGSVFYVLLPIFTKDILGGNSEVVALFLAAYSIGIALGSLLCNRLTRGLAAEFLVPVGAAGLTLFGVDFFFASGGDLIGGRTGLFGVSDYFTEPARWRLFMDLAGMAISGGLYTIPLYTQIQKRAADGERSRVFAALNILNAFGMVSASVFITFLSAQGFPLRYILLAVSLLNIPVAIYIARVVFKALFDALVRRIYSLT